MFNFAVILNSHVIDNNFLRATFSKMQVLNETKSREFSQEPVRLDNSMVESNFQFFNALKQPNVQLESMMKKRIYPKGKPKMNFRHFCQ
jgi:hypothetical protein